MSHQHATIDVFDGDFKHLFEVPTEFVSHTPPPELNITRLVFCRNYQPGNPQSCPLGASCKFVHVECALSELPPASTVHVKYCWHHEDECTYERLPKGEVLRVSAPNNRLPFENIPSELVLVTRGSANRHTHSGQLSHCAHFFFNRMCKRGSLCHFIHTVVVDPKNVPSGHFSRASTKSRKAAQPKISPITAESLPEQHQHHHESLTTTIPSADSFVLDAMSPAHFSHTYKPPAAVVSPAMLAAEQRVLNEIAKGMFQGPPSAVQRVYRHNPYSLSKSTVYLLG